MGEDGTLVGLVPARKSFEWRRPNGETIVGTVQGDIAKTYEQSLFADHPLLGPMHAQFAVRRVTRRGGTPRSVSLCFRFARVAVSETSNARFHYLRTLIMTTEILRNNEESSECRKVYYHYLHPEVIHVQCSGCCGLNERHFRR